jgi:hypothetical protein
VSWRKVKKVLTDMKLEVVFVLLLQVCLVFGGKTCSDDKPCVRFCCETCQNDTDISDQPRADDVKKPFDAIFGRPCEKMFGLEVAEYEADEWDLKEVRQTSFQVE